MNHKGFHNGLATKRAVDVRVPVPARQGAVRTRYRELELQLAILQKENSDLRGAIGEAAQVYRRLCAPCMVRYDNFEIASETFAVRHVPGDFFTVEKSGTEVILGLGDICGKGLAAGMWTTHLVGLIGTHSATSTAPASIASHINQDLCRLRGVAPLSSLFLARLDPVTGRLDYSNAGHPSALLLRADGTLEALSEGGPLLGVVSSAYFASGRVQMMKGDVLVVCSDGILESLNNDDQEFGTERLESHLRSARGGPADALLFSMLGAVQDFAAARPLVDDISLVVVRNCIQ